MCFMEERTWGKCQTLSPVVVDGLYIKRRVFRYIYGHILTCCRRPLLLPTDHPTGNKLFFWQVIGAQYDSRGAVHLSNLAAELDLLSLVIFAGCFSCFVSLFQVIISIHGWSWEI